MDQLKHLIISPETLKILISIGPDKLTIQVKVKSTEEEKKERRRKQPGRPCKPYPFGNYHLPNIYIENNYFVIIESGASDFIEPCHEYKAFINTPDEKIYIKFIYEVIRFAAACMNSRTNGTIHFGIGDKPLYTHGQVLGVVVEDREAYGKELKSAIDRSFEHKHKQIAHICIKPPRFVSVLNKNDTTSDKCVIEVDIVPDSAICGENIFHTFDVDTKKAEREREGKVNPKRKPQKQFFVRDGGSSSNFFAEKEKYNQFVQLDHIKKLTQLRKQSEEKHLNVIKSSTQGLRLGQEEDPLPGIMDPFKHPRIKTVVILNFLGPAKLTTQARGKSTKEEPVSSRKQPGRPCKPYPFGKYHPPNRYIENNYFDIIESGASDFIEPCHEYKAFINTPDEKKYIKFNYEAIRFAAACMNSRTNGTIHFGIGDKPHGQVLGVVVEDREAYGEKLKSAIDRSFEHKHKQIAHICIKPPRFVSVLNTNMTSSDKCVIEVDIVPDSAICAENIFHTFDVDTIKNRGEGEGTVNPERKPKKQFFVRDGGSSSNFFADKKKYNQFIQPDHIKKLTQLRKQSEEKHLSVIKSSTQGRRLNQMITGGSLSLDKSHFERYVIVTNKSHPVQLESLGFLGKLNPTAVLDFDPESVKHGLQCHFEQQSTVSVHLPAKYKITEEVEDIADKLELTRNTSWVFCNGGIEDEIPSEIDESFMDKGASIRDEISFLCRKDVLPNKRCLVIFLLLSTVSEEMDPLFRTFSTFVQELKGTEQILCVCDNENAFIYWRDLIDARCGIDISSRCIYELSLAEVNGTILSLFSKHLLSKNFLTCGGGGKVLLKESVKQSLNTLEVHSVNQREKLDSGGTDVAMFISSRLRNNFRFAVLRSCNADFTEVAEQVVTLLMYGHEEQVPRVPVLLMIDDTDDNNKVSDLQQVIDKECAKKGIQGMSAKVIPLESPTNGSSSHKVHYDKPLAIQY